VTCRAFVDLLIDYVDGDLDAQTRARFDRHLATCPDCRHYLNHYQASIQASLDAFAADVPSNMPEGLVRAILDARTARDV
jgi:anti-sigma factor RsiW